MKRKFKALILIILAPFLVFAFYIGFLWATYIDQTITEGQQYGFTIGTTKYETYTNVAQLLEEHPNLVVYISYGPRAGDNITFPPTPGNYEQAQKHNNWSLLLDGDGEFFNVIKLKHENNTLQEIYRHRKYFEAP